MIIIKNFDSNLLKIDKKSYKNIDTYYSGYITMKDSDYVKINSVNPLYLIIDKVDGYTEKKNGNKDLILTFKYRELCDEIKNLIKEINDKLGKYGKDFMKIKFNPDFNLPLNKRLKLHNLTIFVTSSKYYPQAFLDDCLYEL